MQERLVIRRPSTKRMEADGPGAEIHLAAHQPVRPAGVYREGPAEQAHRARLRGASDEDDHPVRWSLQIGLPRVGEETAGRRGLNAAGGARAVRADIALGALLEGAERIVMEARPDLGLPAAVEAFDGGLETAFLRRRKDGNDPEVQARPHHAPQGILPPVGAAEDGVVVELGVGRQAELPPVLHQASDHEGSRDGLPAGPGSDQAAMYRDPVENLDLGAALEDQALDDIEAVQLHPSGGQVGQIPTQRRGGRRRRR